MTQPCEQSNHSPPKHMSQIEIRPNKYQYSFSSLLNLQLNRIGRSKLNNLCESESVLANIDQSLLLFVLFGPALFILLSWNSASLKLLGVSLWLAVAVMCLFVHTDMHERAIPSDISPGRLNSKSRAQEPTWVSAFAAIIHLRCASIRSHDPARLQDSSPADVLITVGGSNFAPALVCSFMGPPSPSAGVKLLCTPRALAERNRCGPRALDY